MIGKGGGGGGGRISATCHDIGIHQSGIFSVCRGERGADTALFAA